MRTQERAGARIDDLELPKHMRKRRHVSKAQGCPEGMYAHGQVHAELHIRNGKWTCNADLLTHTGKYMRNCT